MKKFPAFRFGFMTFTICSALITGFTGTASAQTMIMPVKVTFENRDRMQDVTLFNPSSTAAVTYKLSWLNRAQVENGDYKAIEGPLNKEFDPETALIFTPRQVTLPPNGKQKLRISLRKPADLPDGEYRAHLNLQRMGKSSPKNIPGTNVPEGMTLKMGMNFGIAIPVIIRQGKYDTTATVSAPKFLPASADGKQPAKIQFDITRNGKYSANGNIQVFWTPPGGQEQLLALRNGVKVYHELNHLQVAIPLKDGITQVNGGSVRILFEGADPDEGITFDERTFPIGG